MLGEILPIFSLTSAIFIASLGIFVFLATKRSKSAIIFCLFCISIAIWLFSAFKMLSSKGDVLIIFWDKMVYVGVVFIPILMYHFGLIFTKLEQKQKKILWLGYILSFVFLILSRTDYFVEDLYKYSWGAHTQARFFHHIFLAFFVLCIFLFFLNIYRYYKKTSNIEKTRAKYILLSFGFLSIGGIAYLPAYGIDIPPLIAYLAELIGAVILALAITRYHLFEIRVILTELLVGVMGVVLVTLPFLMPTSSLRILASFIFLIFLIIGYLLIKSAYKEMKKREEVENFKIISEQLNTKLAKTIDLENVVSFVSDTLKETFKIEKIAVLLKQLTTEFYLLQKTIGFDKKEIISLIVNTDLCSFLEKEKEPLTDCQLPSQIEKTQERLKKENLKTIFEKMKENEISLIFPLFQKENIVAILFFGQKLSDSFFSEKEINLLKAISYQISISFNNSLLFQEIIKDKEIFEKFHKLTLDRALRIIKLKGKVKDLEKKLKEKEFEI